jgi:5-formyltetrahydrofolate cyclo-ligase
MTEDFDWKGWRRLRRRELIAARQSLAPADRAARNTAIDALLEAGFGPVSGSTVGFCWPFAAEPEPRFAVRRWREAGSRACLPVVVAARHPLEFREWWPGAPMATGVYDIPYPNGTEILAPEVCLVPVNGFDAAGYRLGYGGGFFDRTLAAMPLRPLCIGLGYETARLATIHPQPHDIAFDFIVTEAGIHERRDSRLHAVAAADAAERVRQHLA